MKPKPYTLKETDAIRLACRTEPIEVVAERFGRGVTTVAKIARLWLR